MNDEASSRDTRTLFLIPVLANVFFLAGIPFYTDMTAGLAIPLLILPWGITYFARRFIDYFVGNRSAEHDAPDGFV